MAQITVTVGGRNYTLACADGEEQRLSELAAYVDGKAAKLSTKLGQVSESRLLLMVAILIADEMREALEGKGQGGLPGGFSETDLAHLMTEVAADVEGIAARLQAS
ncbi:cell division protein ZapA [Eilatimonas milleporae]|uniref:Cell division protein ZapA n=1 Tax=Eilatimonas milleporae TaxID=911205 RepID=A0A3M0CFT9_9PROT|nr:cell division protein ZapA [Eilatimonas milleporae]RMB07845.1 cell division protein ZapA [Eilatimonas milleporae]